MNNYTIYSVDSAYMLLYSIYCSEQVFLKAPLGGATGVVLFRGKHKIKAIPFYFIVSNLSIAL